VEDHSPEALQKARRLRKEMSLPEVKLWQYLRSKPQGLKFRRQHPIGNLILDFYCSASRTAIEIDGIAHDMGDRPMRDQQRDRWLEGQGISVLRIPAGNVLRDCDEVAGAIVRYCQANMPPPSGLRPATSPNGGG